MTSEGQPGLVMCPILSQTYMFLALKNKLDSPRRFALVLAYGFLRRTTPMLFVVMLSIGAPNETGAAGLRPLRIAYLFTSGTMASVWVAKETGGFVKEGLDVEMISMPATLAVPALIANEVDEIQVFAVPVLIADNQNRSCVLLSASKIRRRSAAFFSSTMSFFREAYLERTAEWLAISADSNSPSNS